MEIAPGIHRIGCTFGDRVVYVHLITGGERVVLVDTGLAFSPEQDIFPYMQKLGLTPAALDLVFITHSDSDHQGGNDVIRRAAPRAQFACHLLDAPWIENAQALINERYGQFERRDGIGPDAAVKAAIARECASSTPMDWHLQGGERYRIGAGRTVRFVHTPGHTWGHTAVLDESSRTLIAGEAALHTAILGLNGQPALPPTYAYIASYQATLERLLGMDLAVYSPAHWPVQRGNDIRTFLSESLNYCRETEQKLLALLRAAPAPLTLQAIITALNDELGDWPKSMAGELAHGLGGHLNWLVSRGLVAESEAGGRRVFAAVR